MDTTTSNYLEFINKFDNKFNCLDGFFLKGNLLYNRLYDRKPRLNHDDVLESIKLKSKISLVYMNRNNIQNYELQSNYQIDDKTNIAFGYYNKNINLSFTKINDLPSITHSHYNRRNIPTSINYKLNFNENNINISTIRNYKFNDAFNFKLGASIGSLKACLMAENTYNIENKPYIINHMISYNLSDYSISKLRLLIKHEIPHFTDVFEINYKNSILSLSYCFLKSFPEKELKLASKIKYDIFNRKTLAFILLQKNIFKSNSINLKISNNLQAIVTYRIKLDNIKLTASITNSNNNTFRYGVQAEIDRLFN